MSVKKEPQDRRISRNYSLYAKQILEITELSSLEERRASSIVRRAIDLYYENIFPKNPKKT